jgi:hypothetical protein
VAVTADHPAGSSPVAYVVFAVTGWGARRIDRRIGTTLLARKAVGERMVRLICGETGAVSMPDESARPRSAGTVSVLRGRDNSSWSARVSSRPTYDRWRMFGAFDHLVAHTSGAGR